MSGFIALSVFLAKISNCAGPVCWAARADAVFAALGYAVWAAETVVVGIKISKSMKQDRDVLEIVKG